MTRSLTRLALAIALAGGMAAAQATTLDLNQVTTSVDIVGSYFGGTLLDTAITSISNSSYNGTARTAVYSTSTGLDFYYQFTNNASSKNGVERFTGYDFSSLGASTVEVFQTATAFGIFSTGTENSDTADRTSLGVIGFNFIPNGHTKINPGTTSYIEIIHTNARNYQAGNFGLLDGIGDNAAGFAPATAVPEPGSVALVLAGFGLIGVMGMRRGRNQA